LETQLLDYAIEHLKKLNNIIMQMTQNERQKLKNIFEELPTKKQKGDYYRKNQM